MSSGTSTIALEVKGMPTKSDCPNFFFAFAALIFVMVMAAVSYLAYPKLRLEPAVDFILSCTYAQDLYDHGCKTLSVIIQSLSSLPFPKSNDSGSKSRTQGRGKGRGRSQPVTFYKGYSLLISLVVTVVLSSVNIGEASWFSGEDDGGVVEGVNELAADYGNVEGVSMEVC